MKEIVSIIKQAENAYQKAELQLEFVKLSDFLRDNEERLRNIERVVIEKDKRIAELEEILKHKNNLIRYQDAYYEKDINGNASGKPFCLACWDIHYKKISLVRSRNSAHIQVCPFCKSEQRIERAPPAIKIDQTHEAIEKPIVIGSCYKFSDSEQLYCSSCYDNDGKKSLVTKVALGLCQCPTCKAALSMR